MNQVEFEQKLDRLKEPWIDKLPDSVRCRMDQTYRMLGDVSAEQMQVPKKRSWLRRVMIVAVYAAVAGLLLIGSGFISPAMALTLKQIPLVESVFKLAGDLGLQAASEQGVTADVNQSVTHQGWTLRASELMYDGSRLSVVLSREMAEKNKQSFMDWWRKDSVSEEGLVANIDFYINGEQVNTGWGVASGGDQAPDSIIVTTFESPNLQIPDEFELGMVVFIPQLEQKFEFKLPVTKNTLNDVVLTPEVSKSHDHIHLKLNRIELSRTTTRLVAEIKGEQGEDIHNFMKKIPDKYKTVGDFLNIEFEIMDDQGRTMKWIGGNGTGDDEVLSYSVSWEPFEILPKSVTVKALTRDAEGEKIYIPELEFTVPVE
ncbi:DUF4179 domain-containing protein [Paenibacillus albidus]|uniref:DUF4179 domain-containing protein n=1 Tax=Paenibacillus albidus TaxID=2041023 RepID=UPI001BE958BC|nr:DUF4179 domain-containing protein [Paenibacillus albidus]MBT2291668.1 DUF4179 domain-containing protein [Paenibacillus albidus]